MNSDNFTSVIKNLMFVVKCCHCLFVLCVYNTRFILRLDNRLISVNNVSM